MNDRALIDRAEVIASQMRALSPLNTSPIHLHSIARRLRVADIRVTDLATDGQMFWSAGQPHITLSKELSENRRRFTLAHELAHVMLGHGGVRERSQASRESYQEDERLCDIIAGALLMPEDHMRDFMGGELGFDRLQDYCDLLKVSRSAFVVRLSQLNRTRPFALVDLDQVAGEEWMKARITGNLQVTRQRDLTFKDVVIGAPAQPRIAGGHTLSSVWIRFDAGKFILRAFGQGRVRKIDGVTTASVFVTSVRPAPHLELDEDS